jgi:hypothetical protein
MTRKILFNLKMNKYDSSINMEEYNRELIRFFNNLTDKIEFNFYLKKLIVKRTKY